MGVGVVRPLAPARAPHGGHRATRSRQSVLRQHGSARCSVLRRWREGGWWPWEWATAVAASVSAAAVATAVAATTVATTTLALPTTAKSLATSTIALPAIAAIPSASYGN